MTDVSVSTRRALLAAVAGAALVAVPSAPARGARAQDATPGAEDGSGGGVFAGLGLPEIAVTITERAYEGAPTGLAAGRYLVTVTNALPPGAAPEAGPGGSGIGFLRLPDDLPAADFVAMMGPAGAGPAASPAAAGGPPEGAEMEMGPPPWYYETTLAGGVYALPGETSAAVVDLGPGQWILWGEQPGAAQPPVPLTVSGEMPADLPTPVAALRVEMSEMAFAFPPALAAGAHVVELVNVGEQPHFLGLAGVPAGTMVEDALALFAMFGDPEATPAAGGLGFADLDPALDTADQSAGVTAWYPVDLAAGTYLAVCFVPDRETGIPHAMLGMTQIVEVG